MATLTLPAPVRFRCGVWIVDLRMQDAHAHLQVSLLIRKGHDGSLQVHGLHEHGVADLKLLRIDDPAVLRHGGRSLVRAFAALFLHGVHLLAKPRALPFHLPGGIGLSAVAVVVADRFIRVSLRIPQDLSRFLPGFGQDLLPGFLQAAAPAFQ